MNKMKSIYESPQIDVEAVSVECGFAVSGQYNKYGLQDIYGDSVNDMSEGWE